MEFVMSRIGNKPIRVPSGVSVDITDGILKVKGPKGELDRSIVDGVSVVLAGGTVTVSSQGDSPSARAKHGLMRALLANMITGVSTGFERKLEIVGVGYRAAVRGSNLELNLGFSHPVVYPFPAGVTCAVDKNTVTVKGIDKEVVGRTASVIRGFRPPDSYKGKGVRYAGEAIRIKAGKSAR